MKSTQRKSTSKNPSSFQEGRAGMSQRSSDKWIQATSAPKRAREERMEPQAAHSRTAQKMG